MDRNLLGEERVVGVVNRKDAPMSEAELFNQPDQPVAVLAPDTDVVSAIRTVLQASEEPLTLSKIRTALPSRLRSSPEDLAEVIRRQVAANVFVQYPKYRSPQERFWDRPMPIHLANLLRNVLEEKPLAMADIRRKLPDYAKTLAEPILEAQVAKGILFRHPPLNSRTGPRFGIGSPQAREYLRPELTKVFLRLEQLGFTQAQLREGAMELLNEAEWAEPNAMRPQPTITGAEGQARANGDDEETPSQPQS
jgi:hypothetical protein